MAMRIGVIGYKNHAERLIRAITQQKDVTELWVFHPKKERLSNLNFLVNSINQSKIILKHRGFDI